MPKKILIVDDESYVRLLVTQVLEDFQNAGVLLLTANDGPAAWEAIEAEQPDVVILDIMLPGFSGYELCQRIKRDPALAATCVIMLTAKSQAADRQRGLDAGADEYITKPFDPHGLVKRTAEALQFTL